MSKECDLCVKRKTMYCPNSSKCYSTEEKPFYQNRIMLLQENQQLKESYCNRTDCSGRLHDSRKYPSVKQQLYLYKSVLDEIREYIKEQLKELESQNDKITHCLSYQDLIDEFKDLLQILDKVNINPNDFSRMFENCTTLEPFLEYMDKVKE